MRSAESPLSQTTPGILMKPCFNNRKLIALYVLGSLQPERATSVREHLVVCEGCRAYFNELSNVSASLSTAEPQGITPSASFHRELVRRIKAETAEPVLTRMAESIRGLLLNWRVAVPAGVGLAVVLGILLTLP